MAPPAPETSALSVCVFCGSRNGTDPAYLDAARTMGEVLAREGWRLIYGAGDVGMMGAVANAAGAGGGAMLGVIPSHLVGHERQGSQDGIIVTETMHERKKVMVMNADTLAVLPGGAGSLDEFFEVLTWAQLGLHRKPIYLVDTSGYWAPLMELIHHVIDQGFADQSLLAHITLVPDPEAFAADLRIRLSAAKASAE
ncbi:MAG: TIGR00730 family Rossman fold protein [Pseudomonadota bacterium]